MKAFLKALLIGVLLIWACGALLEHWFSISIMFDGDALAPLWVLAALVIAFAAVVWVVFLVLVGTISVIAAIFGAILLLPLLLLALPVVAVVGAFWPVLLVCLVLYLMLRDKPSHSA